MVKEVNSNHQHHRPFKWSLLRVANQQVIATQITSGAPSFAVTLCQLVPRYQCDAYLWFYMCPASNPGKGYCDLPNHYYCAYWGCETIAPGWIPGSGADKYLKVQWSPRGCKTPQSWRGRDSCKHLVFNVTHHRESSWFRGRMWGLRYSETGRDQGGLILIKKETIPNDPLLIGPDIVPINKKPSLHVTDPKRHYTPITPHTTTNPDDYVHPLWKIMQASYQVLNKTNPNLTEHCWLCYGMNPPYYEGIAVNDAPAAADTPNPPQCLWDVEKQSITLAEIVGSGTCIGHVPQQKRHLCASRIHRLPPVKWIIPVSNAKWVCSSTGITPCLALDIFNESAEFCVQTTIVPKIYYHPENYVYNSITTPEHHLVKREPITALTIALLMLAGGTGAGTGIASLVLQNKEFGALKVAVDEDIARIEESITALAKSLKSLSEVVLQNRRGLDMLFLQAGGLCAALKEECCVYADHTGIVRDTMAKLRERLEKRKRERESQQNWFTSLFDQSPWLTTLISALIGALTVILVALVFGPCVFNKFMAFVKNRLDTIHIMRIERRHLL